MGNGGPDVDLSDLLNGGRRPQGPRKAKALLQLLEVSLADIYTGTKKKMKVNRDRLCADCGGKGGKEESIKQCTVCGGVGRVAKVIRMGMMISQTITHCDACGGKGKMITDPCKTCKSKGIREDIKILDIEVDKGTPEGHRYTFAGEGDEFVLPFLLIFILARSRSWRYHHRGADHKE